MASQQLDLKKLGDNLKSEFWCNLVNAEQLYVSTHTYMWSYLFTVDGGLWTPLLTWWLSLPVQVNKILNKTWPIINKVETLEGITIPVGNSKKIHTSIRAINDYLGVHLPPIIRNITTPMHQADLLSNITVFHNRFRNAVQLSSADPKETAALSPLRHRNTSPSDTYQMKKMGFKIIHNTKLWVQNFTNPTNPCGLNWKHLCFDVYVLFIYLLFVFI